jgi:hypothetical protein
MSNGYYKIWLQPGNTTPTIPPTGNPNCTVPISWNGNNTCSWQDCQGNSYSGPYGEASTLGVMYYSGGDYQNGTNESDYETSTKERRHGKERTDTPPVTIVGTWVAQSSN